MNPTEKQLCWDCKSSKNRNACVFWSTHSFAFNSAQRILFFVLLTVSCELAAEGKGGSNQQAAVEKTAEEKPADKEVLHLREHFGEQNFFPKGGFILRQGQPLPDLVWEHPDLVGKVLKDIAIPTRWFDADFNEVKVARTPGRYYVYGEAPAPHGPVLRRAMTAFCVDKETDLTALAEKQISIAEPDPKKKRALIEKIVTAWQTTEEGVVEFAALMETGFDRRPVRPGQWQMENATRHVQLKRKLMGLDGVPPVVVAPRSIKTNPAPVLRAGSLDETRFTPDQLKALEDKFDRWYAEAQQPTAVVIAQRGVVVFSKGYGALEEQPVTINTPMLLHSAMKPILGVLLATYLDRGFVKLNEPVGKYLVDFKSEEDRGLTFRAGFVHTTGIHFPWPLAFSRLFYFHTWHESLIAHCKRDWAPGAKHQYGVVGMILSVRALELLRGLNYWDAMERDLFTPMGIRNMLPGGTGFSAEDLARIGVLLANHGKYGDWEFFSEETYKSILPAPLKPHFPQVNLTFGIGLQSYAGSFGPGSYGHGGGCGTQLIVNPEKHLVFAMVRNAPGEAYEKHLNEVLAFLNAWNSEPAK